MLRNYFKMALNVLLRKKFYTLISMFGICVTLTILLVVYALWEHSVGAQPPETKLGRSLFVDRVQIIEKNGGSKSPVSFYFLDRYVRQLKEPEAMSFYSHFSTVNAFVEDKKVEMDLKYTDATFWEIMEFDFIEGRPYREEEVLKRQPVTILSRELKEKIFGQASAIGKSVALNNERYKVIGVIENVSYTRSQSYATIYLPYSHSRDDLKKPVFKGQFMATLLARSPAHRKDVINEFDAMMKQIENPDPDRITSINIHADTYLATFARPILGGEHTNDSGIGTLYTVLFIIFSLFMVLPTVNMININISRIMERASEIGLRKAFGATSLSIVWQFVLENTVLTFICGIFSIGFAFLVLEMINSSHLIPHSRLLVNFNVFGGGLLIALLFGVLSGVYPAWRMSRLQAADALKIS